MMDLSLFEVLHSQTEQGSLQKENRYEEGVIFSSCLLDFCSTPTHRLISLRERKDGWATS